MSPCTDFRFEFPIIKLSREEYLKTVRGFTFKQVGREARGGTQGGRLSHASTLSRGQQLLTGPLAPPLTAISTLPPSLQLHRASPTCRATHTTSALIRLSPTACGEPLLGAHTWPHVTCAPTLQVHEPLQWKAFKY